MGMEPIYKMLYALLEVQQNLNHVQIVISVCVHKQIVQQSLIVVLKPYLWRQKVTGQ